MKKMTNKELQKIFKRLNDRFFAGRIRDMGVRFANDDDCQECDGLCTSDDIFIHDTLRRHPDLACLVLLHEMIHADLYQDGYIGHESDGGHHTRFYAGIDRLYKAGAFEGLL